MELREAENFAARLRKECGEMLLRELMCANGVGRHLEQSISEKLDSALKSAVRDVGIKSRRIDVYDLRVAKDHEFFANGVLVHNSEHGKGAYTVGFKMGIDFDARFWVLNVIRGRWNTAQRERVILQTAQLDGIKVIVGLEQEPGSGGKESVEASIRNLRGFVVRVVRPSGSIQTKELRADPFSTQVNNSNVFLVEGPWNEAMIEEYRFFPFGKYKDQVDSGSGAFTILSKPRLRVGAI